MKDSVTFIPSKQDLKVEPIFVVQYRDEETFEWKDLPGSYYNDMDRKWMDMPKRAAYRFTEACHLYDGIFNSNTPTEQRIVLRIDVPIDYRFTFKEKDDGICESDKTERHD